jgi:hypothetical protein
MVTQVVDPPRPSREEIRLELERIVSSSAFRGSKRCKDFATYVCTKALHGEAETLKERTIAIDVFGRHSCDDYGDENIVRVGAREVRKRLALYYSGEGAEAPLRIELPIGSYVPVFRYRADTAHIPIAPLAPARVIANVGSKPTRFWHSARLWLGIAAAVTMAVWLGDSAVWPYSSRDFEAFWKPAFVSPSPLVLISHPIVYQPSSRALLLDEQINGKADLPIQRAIKIPPASVGGGDFVPVLNEYVGLGDANAALGIYWLFSQHSRKPSLRLADKVEFNDLYGSSAVLIGGSFTNRWTAEMTKNLRYRFDFEGESKPWIVDTQTGQKWGLSAITDDRRTAEDYILICRIPRAQSGAFLVIVAGLTSFGTDAGGKLVSDPALLEPILRSLPPNWASRNLQMVMRVEVIGDGPALPRLVASYTW